MKITFQKNFKKVIKHLDQPMDNYSLLIGSSEKSLNVEKMLQTISHWGTDYSNPVSSAFLFNVRSLQALTRCPVLFCRDGLFTILDFFHRHPRPGGIQTILVINYSFISFVPVSWRTNVVFYEFGLHAKLNFSSLAKERESLIIKGFLLSSSFRSLDDYTSVISQIKQASIKKYKKIKIFIWSRENNFLNHIWSGDRDQTSRLNHFYPSLYKVLDEHPDVEFMLLEDLLRMKNYHQYSFIDVNKKSYYVGDDYLDFVLLSKGVIPGWKLRNKSIAKNEFCTLSPYHGYSILNPVYNSMDEFGVESIRLNKIKSIMNIKNDELSSEFYTYVSNVYEAGYTTSLKNVIFNSP